MALIDLRSLELSALCLRLGEIEESELDRLLDLVRETSRQQHVGDVRLEQLRGPAFPADQLALGQLLRAVAMPRHEFRRRGR